LTLFLINTHLFIKQVNVTLWGKLGEEIDVSSTPVIALKGVKLVNSKIFGTSLKTTSVTIMKVQHSIN
jgi:hypothetical protein